MITSHHCSTKSPLFITCAVRIRKLVYSF